MSKGMKILLGVILTIVIIIGAVIGGGALYVNSLLNKVEQVEIKEEELAIEPEIEEQYGEIRNIALFGIDAEDGKNGRSDAIMILTLDSVNNKMKLTSIMRDSYVNIGDRGLDKINHAYAFGAPELAVRTLNENFGLNIKEFAAVNFTSLPKIIDKIGGVEIDIIQEEISHIPGVNSTGNQTLSGTQALAYARIRYASGGDYKRTERQRDVINAVFEKLKSTPVTQYPALISDFLPFIQTNMSSSDLLGLATEFAGLIPSGLQQDRFPRDGQGQGQTINGIYYLTFDIPTVRESMKEYIFEDK